jgi:hypothetical protein
MNSSLLLHSGVSNQKDEYFQALIDPPMGRTRSLNYRFGPALGLRAV